MAEKIQINSGYEAGEGFISFEPPLDGQCQELLHGAGIDGISYFVDERSDRAGERSELIFERSPNLEVIAKKIAALFSENGYPISIVEPEMPVSETKNRTHGSRRILNRLRLVT